MKALMAGGGTGGHLYPMLAIADTLKEQGHTAVFVGSRDRLETRLVPEAGYPYHPIDIRPGKNLLHLGRAAASAWEVLKQEKPDVVVGAGGYICFPAVMAALVAGIPVVLLEQNAHPGLANQVLAPFSRMVLTSFPHTKLPKAVWTGNPLRQAFTRLNRPNARQSLGLTPSDKLLVVTGGSLGAKQLNDWLMALAPRILALPDWKIFHLSGERDHVRVLETMTQQQVGERYHLEAYSDQMAELFWASDLVISRAGATAVAEMAACGTAAVLVPGSFAGGHQRANATAMVERGGAVLIEPGTDDPEAIWQVLEPLLTDHQRRQQMHEASLKLGRPQAAREAAERIVALKR